MASKWLLVILVAFALMPALMAQEDRSEAQDRLTGKVVKVDKAKSTILVQHPKAERQVLFDNATRFTMWNQPGSLDAVKEGRTVICRGKFDSKNRLIATRVEVRDR